MNIVWLACIVCVMLLVIYIIFAENWVHMFRSNACTNTTTVICPPHSDHGHHGVDGDAVQKAMNVGLVGGPIWGSAMSANSSDPPP